MTHDRPVVLRTSGSSRGEVNFRRAASVYPAPALETGHQLVAPSAAFGLAATGLAAAPDSAAVEAAVANLDAALPALMRSCCYPAKGGCSSATPQLIHLR